MTHAMFRAAAATYFLLALPSLSQAQSLPGDALLTKGIINFAADFAAAPNQFLNADGTRDGLNVDICGKIAEKMELKIEWTNLAFPGLVPGLQAKRFDALCTAIFINPQRLEIMNMVPYVQWGEGLMVPISSSLGSSCAFKSGDAASYNGCFDELSGKTVSVASAGTTNKNLAEQSSRLVAAGKKAINVRAFDTNSDAIQALVSGQADAAYLNDPQAAFYISRSNKNYKLTFTGFASNQLALTTLKPNTALADAFVTALDAMKTDGSYKTILDKWGVASVPSFAYKK
jgi:polar amino acid transport system substrate-binding protein